MSQSRPKLNNLKRVCPQDLAHCEGYVWHLGTKIGKGSFGEVYLGWTNDGNTEVAVKVVRKEYFKQDPKVRENLEREIRILKLLRGCEYVVQILHVQELRHFIVLVMELCDYDLDHLVKVEPFKEETVIVFLYQLAQGMKALRNQNIVHRDLKPGNILIKSHPTTKKMMIKLADFGFARHYKDEGNKAIDMTSLAGTPVFMAPEALSCVFHPGEHYDDKVDIWSIGALLYKIIVGQCGFYAQLQDIPRILKHKGDAIAFERAPNRKINYIYELPSTVNNRLSESFRDKMKNLLCSMLKLDPRERMTFTEFFENVDDIIRSKIEITNLLHGTAFKIISDATLTANMLIEKVHIQWHIPSVAQVIFSTSCSYFIAPHGNLSQAHLVELLEKSGGSKGHAKLYLLPINQLKQAHVSPDTTFLTSLKYTVDDQATIVNLITEQKFSDEIVHMIGYLGSQQKKQLEGLEELAQFTLRELGMFKSNIYPRLLEQVHQTVAKASLASKWLDDDIAIFHNQDSSKLTSLRTTIDGYKTQLQQTLMELDGFNDRPIPTLDNPLSREEISRNIAAFSERAKKLSKARKDQIQPMCNEISKDCVQETSRVTEIVKTLLIPFSDALTHMWSLEKSSSDILERCSAVNQLLDQISQDRLVMLGSLFSGNRGSELKTQAAQVTAANQLPLVTPPTAWPVGSSYLPPTNQTWADPSVIDDLKRQVEQLSSQLGSSTEENIKLKTELSSFKTQEDSSADISEVESTLVPSKLSTVNKPQQTSDTVKVIEGLAEQLQQFCVLVEKMNLGGSTSPKPKPAVVGAGGALYPNLLDDYSVISMPSGEHDIQKLLPLAQQMSASLGNNISSLKTMIHKSNKEITTLTSNSALIKIGRPQEYEQGDVVLFTGVRTVKSKSTIPALLHLQQNKPYILLDAASYSNFNVRPGKMPELFIGRLLEAPRKVKFEDDRATANDIGEESGEFYLVPAEYVQLKFSAKRSGSTLDASRPPPPSKPPHSPTTGFNWKPFHRSGNKSDRGFV